jgi:hypothetical protein
MKRKALWEFLIHDASSVLAADILLCHIFSVLGLIGLIWLLATISINLILYEWLF